VISWTIPNSQRLQHKCPSATNGKRCYSSSAGWSAVYCLSLSRRCHTFLLLAFTNKGVITQNGLAPLISSFHNIYDISFMSSLNTFAQGLQVCHAYCPAIKVTGFGDKRCHTTECQSSKVYGKALSPFLSKCWCWQDSTPHGVEKFHFFTLVNVYKTCQQNKTHHPC